MTNSILYRIPNNRLWNDEKLV